VVTQVKTKTLLPVVAILLLIKFVLAPVVEWQNETLIEIERYEKRNEKTQRLLNGETQLLSSLAAVDKEYKLQAEAYPRFNTIADFHIETKIVFDMLLKQNRLKVTQFFWHDSVDKAVFPGMQLGRFNVSFIGNFKDFALLQAKLGSSEKAFRIVNFSTQVKNQSDASVGTVNGTFTIETYYWLGGQ
jgi:hypothetical protein